MRPSLVLLVVLGSACGSSGGSSMPPRAPLGVQGNLAEAREHDAEAAQQEALASELSARSGKDAIACGDSVLADQVSSGGERLLRPPCWTAEPAAAERHRAEAERLRDEAAGHRARARALREAEQASCARMAPADLEHTPFAHLEDVATVVAELEGDRLRGARIQFDVVPGLTEPWLREALACHQARAAALAYDPTYMSYDPSVVAGAEVTVEADPAGVVVTIVARDDAAARIIYDRAEELLGPAAR